MTVAMSTDPRFAEPTPFARLVYAHAISVAGDACLTVSLAGSLFFQNPTGAGAGKGAPVSHPHDGALRHRGPGARARCSTAAAADGACS